jgi:5-(carboxyamino)imidazole ribonucleotide synthase
MLALAAGRLGYRVHTYSPEGDSPHRPRRRCRDCRRLHDLERRRFADGVDAVTFEFENVPSASVAAISERALVRPAGSVLHTTQHRGREKSFLSRAGLPVAPYALIDSLDDLSAALIRLGLPAVLKTASFGYDGKGQARTIRPRTPRRWIAWTPARGPSRSSISSASCRGSRARRRRTDRALRSSRTRTPGTSRRLGRARTGDAAGLRDPGHRAGGAR